MFFKEFIVPLFFVMLSGNAFASDVHNPKDLNYYLVHNSASVIASYGLSWPEGKQALVTTYRINGVPESLPKETPALFSREVYRCIEYFDKSFSSSGGKCERVKP